MIYRITNSLKFFKYIWAPLPIKGMLTLRVIQPFSIAGIRTFGHFFYDKDPVLGQLKALNKSYASRYAQPSNILNQYLRQNLNQTTLNEYKDKLIIEDSNEREFNIFEVVAYCLYIEMIYSMKNQPQNKQIDQKAYAKNRIYFFTKFKNFLDALMKEEQNRLNKSYKRTSTQKIHMLKCERMFSKKQIYRRFYQICKFEQKDNPLLFQFAQKIDQQYDQFAKILISMIQHSSSLEGQNIFELKSEQQKIKAQFHQFIRQQITSLFSSEVENGYYTPLLRLQNRFKVGSGFDQTSLKFNKDQNEQNKQQIQQIYTFSFIPTSTTNKLNQKINNFYKNLFFSNLKKMGKSTSLLLLAILRGYTKEEVLVLFPQFMIESIPSSIYMCIVQSIWRVLPKNVFIQIQTYAKGIIKASSKKEQNYNIKLSQQKQAVVQYLITETYIYEMLRQIRPFISGVIFDQFSAFIGVSYKQQRNYKLTLNAKQSFKSLQNLFDLAYVQLRLHVLSCASIAFESGQIKKYLSISQQSSNILTYYNQFKNKQAKHLLIIWLNRCLSTAFYLNRISIQNKKSIIKQQQGKKQIKTTQERLKQIKIQIEKFRKKLIKNNQKNAIDFFSGEMNIIKQCAEKVIVFLLQNPKQKLNEDILQQIHFESKVNHYQNLIKKWLQFSKENQNEFKLRQQIIAFLFMGNNAQTLFDISIIQNKINVQIPRFLINKTNQFKLKSQLNKFAWAIWNKVKNIFGQGSYMWQVLLQFLLINRLTSPIAPVVGFLFEAQLLLFIKLNTPIQLNQFFKSIYKLIWKNKSQQLLKSTKKIVIENTAEQRNFRSLKKIAEQIERQLEKQSKQNNFLFCISLHYTFPNCDRIFINVNKQREADVIHIQQGLNKSKQQLLEIKERVNKKLKNKEDFRIQIKNELNLKNKTIVQATITQNKPIYDQSPQKIEKYIEREIQNRWNSQEKQFCNYKQRITKELQKKSINLKSYNILYVTGHRSNQLSQKWEK